jgi:hypothetical protein
MKQTALITGASSGIGLELARLFAADGWDVVLVARSEAKLRELADSLSRDRGISAGVIVADLAKPDAAADIVKTLTERGQTVDALVNNAGLGVAGAFVGTDGRAELETIQVNCVALTQLTKLILPGMVARKRGRILNVASTAAFQPIPYQATYAATKAFVLSFSEAVHTDLHGTGVSCTALCPGPTRTEFTDVAGMQGFDGTPSFVWQTASDVARDGIAGMLAGRRTVVPGLANKASANAGRYTPRSVLLPIMRATWGRA